MNAGFGHLVLEASSAQVKAASRFFERGELLFLRGRSARRKISATQRQQNGPRALLALGPRTRVRSLVTPKRQATRLFRRAKI